MCMDDKFLLFSVHFAIIGLDISSLELFFYISPQEYYENFYQLPNWNNYHFSLTKFKNINFI